MEPGIYVLRLRGGWYGRGIPYVGWLRPYRGDWWHLFGARRLVRRNGDLTPLGVLAARGLTENHDLDAGAPPGSYEVVHVLTSLVRVYPTDPRLWEDTCPRPAGWVGEGES